MNTQKIEVRFSGTYKDGGTEEFRDRGNTKYFVDGRTGSETKGKVFDRYPGDRGAKILNVILVTRIRGY